jgi:hypothetical protein
MKATLKLIPCLLAAALAVMGCRQQDQASADNNANPGTLSQQEAKLAIGDINLGHQVSADGSIAADQKGNNFTPGQPIYLAFRIGKAPAGTLVTVDWFGPDNQPLGSDQKTVTRGETAMDFTSKDTTGWGKGDYHADITVGGQKVDTGRFSIVPPENAENAATKPDNAIADVAVGHQLAADGGIAAGQDGKNFVPGQPVYVVFKAGSAPAGTLVAIEWFGPSGQKLASDQQQVGQGDVVMHFASTSTGNWGLGDYRADLLVNGQKVDTEHFSVVNRNQADKAAKTGK